MKLSQFEARVPMYYAVGAGNKGPRCINLRGGIGWGKTHTLTKRVPGLLARFFAGKRKPWATVEDEVAGTHLFPDNPRAGVVLINGPMLNPTDAMGFMTPQQVQNHLMSVFTEPFWFITTEGLHIDDYDIVIVLIDEADKLDIDVYKGFGECALSGRLGPHRLPPHALLWMAGNRASDKGGTTKQLMHMVNRQLIIDLEFSIDDFLTFCAENGILPLVQFFANQNPHLVAEEVPATPMPFCTPRALCEASEMIRFANELEGRRDESIIVDELLQEELAGKIGQGAAAQLASCIKLFGHTPTWEEVITSPSTAKVPERADAQMLMCYQLAARVDKKTIAPVVEYMERIPPEFAVAFARQAARRDRALVVTPAFSGWARRNTSLMMAIAA